MYELSHTSNIRHNMRKPIINTNLQKGDYILISKMTGYSVHTISSQLRGERTLTDKVKNAVAKIIESRKWLLQNSINQESQSIKSITKQIYDERRN